MKQVMLLFFILGLILGQSCSNRSDKVFSAYDELHGISLFENGQEFELLYNGFNTAKGVYRLKYDTIELTYFKEQFTEFDPSEKLPPQLLIDQGSMKVRSIDLRIPFCATIDLDKRELRHE